MWTFYNNFIFVLVVPRPKPSSKICQGLKASRVPEIFYYKVKFRLAFDKLLEIRNIIY
jgi:hypothetical protein